MTLNNSVWYRRARQLSFAFFLLVGWRPLAGQSSRQTDPSTALRDALIDACSQDTERFVHVLTARNAEAFARMTPPARETLLKRFVLLDKPGKASAQNTSGGRVMISCETPEVTTVMELDKAEHRDNLAFIPLTIRDSTDAAGASAHHVTMGMVRENGQWKILSLGLLFLDLPSLETEWDRAEIKTTEQAAIADLKTLVKAIETYRKTYTRLPDLLSALGSTPDHKSTPERAGLLDNTLASGRKGGYSFRYVIVGANTSGAPAKYEVAAIPLEYGRTGRRSFFYDATGVLHAGDDKGAIGSALDPKLDEGESLESPHGTAPQQ
ncbi:MAG TPA: hypothetical protein VL128_05440 [Candidatus Eisenbacteria bacterium]|nr:hypothetical protein [Candidatus Eisenbacteria bacterium]